MSSTGARSWVLLITKRWRNPLHHRELHGVDFWNFYLCYVFSTSTYVYPSSDEFSEPLSKILIIHMHKLTVLSTDFMIYWLFSDSSSILSLLNDMCYFADHLYFCCCGKTRSPFRKNQKPFLDKIWSLPRTILWGGDKGDRMTYWAIFRNVDLLQSVNQLSCHQSLTLFFKLFLCPHS